MSFVDLATLTLHRRHEMEGRISTFAVKCDQAITNIRKLKTQALTFVNQLNCEPAELKERFLSSMKRLDEYIYLMTEFNLSFDNFEKNESTELAPVMDNSYKNYPALIPTNHYPVLSPTNLMDMLSEPASTASTACANMCPEKPLRRRPRAEQLLIAFSSASCSAESVPGNTVEKEVQCVTQEIEDLTITDPKAIVNLPMQPMLDTERAYEATIMSVDGHTFWIVVDLNEVCKLVQEMKDCYSQEKNLECVSLEELPNFTCCVYHDTAESNGYFRAMLLKTEGDKGPAQVFLVDTGEIRPVTAEVLPLLPRFRTAPPAAHCCHLTDVEFLSTKTKEINEFLKEIVGKNYTMKIDDNSSESLGVYLFLDDECTLNELVLLEGLATALDKPSRPEPPAHGPPEMRASSEDLDYSGPEHDNPVEAVTGYQNRDEMDICKHYQGGSEKTCFKGANCKKRHVVIHPDGWTLDRVPTPKCRSLPLPSPGTWHQVIVTYVAHFDRLFVHFQNNVTEELPSFGMVLPPTTLSALVRDMNSPATYAAFKPLQLAPAPGELVAAQYRDGLWYRARVNCSTHADQSVEVMYIDYGNVVSVKENEIMELEPRFAVLPMQAVCCRLAGVSALTDCSKTWAEAKRHLAALAQDRAMEAHVISRSHDALTVEMVDARGRNLAHDLAGTGTVSYSTDYELDEAGGGCRLVQA